MGCIDDLQMVRPRTRRRVVVVVKKLKVFDRFRLSDQLRSSADSINDFGVIHVASTLQIRKHGYSGDLNIVICEGICTLPFYAINMDVVSLFTDSSFFIFSEFALYRCTLSI
ncbi:hypothetical protein MTR_7g066950 [Medicago truncatula]|uniref:Uncharacterized protein n=1 Tax=Medicago truncatula TaxID=3880 RepID=A0A072U026_MEDTR|nr:hypothetical protein MTR_7g066950 [Medicago truncatula]